MLLAGAGPSNECDEMAAWAPLLLNGQALTPPAPFALSGVKLPEMDVYVCAPGELGNAGALAEAAAGCERILNAQLT
jgi:hypothetical protein